MMAYMNAESLKQTIQTGKTHFWSRTRKQLWIKGQTSGHAQSVEAIYTDCDMDTLLVRVRQQGGACHEGYRSCFFRKLSADGGWQVAAEKVFDPRAVYKRGQ